ncbi:MAG: Uma2 family endonuclease [Hyphomicrobiaceae bacterium]
MGSARPLLSAIDPNLGISRWPWTTWDLERMVSAGILNESEHVELIGGDIIAMAAKGTRHEFVRNRLILYWARRLPQNIDFAEETPLRLGDHDEPEPDIILFPADLFVFNVRGDTVLLVVEIADSSLSYDLRIKAPLYAAFGVREYWVINARTLVATVHRIPGPAGYTEIREVASADLLEPPAAPQLAVRLADLRLP